MVYRKKGSSREEVELLTERVNRIATEREGTLLSTEVVGVAQKIQLRCSEGHEFSMAGRNLIYRDGWCPYCKQGKLYSQEEAVRKLASMGFDLQSKVLNQKDEVLVRCLLCGTETNAQYLGLKNGHIRCKCQKDIGRRTENLNRVSQLVFDKGGNLLDPRPVHQKEHLQVQCAQGHIWSVTASSLLAGSWCSKCSGNHPRTLEELEAIVIQRGGILKTREYRGVDGTYEFECSLGHEFSNMFKKVENGQWCPICSRGSKSEEIARTTLEQLFGVKFSRKRPQWLRNERGYQMELDGFNESIALAFEYQGYQHFQKDHWGTDLEQRIADDELKKQICRERGITLLEITFETEYQDFPKEIQRQLKSVGFDISDVDFTKEIDFSKAYIRDNRLDDLRQLLAEKNIELVSNAWLGVNHKYEMHCLVCDSNWKAKGNAFFNRRGVAGCDYCNRRTPANKQDISTLVDFATLHGGKVLSTEYVRRNHHYMWECSQGHVFEGNFNYMKDKNRFCSECEGWTRKSFISQLEAEAEFHDLGFELQETFTQRSRYLKTKCLRCGFEGSQVLDNLKGGKAKCKGCKLLEQREEAFVVIEKAHAKPLEEFAGRSVPWKCECLKCHSVITPRISDIARGQGACRYCRYDRSDKEKNA